MMTVLDWIDLNDFGPLLVLICLLVFIGGQVSAAEARNRLITQRIAYGAFMPALPASGEHAPSARVQKTGQRSPQRAPPNGPAARQ